MKKIEYDYYQKGDSVEKIIVAIHGWQGNRYSMRPIVNMIKSNNIGWILLEAPFTVENGEGKSWSYQLTDGEWEIEEPRQLLLDFFKSLFFKYPKQPIYVLGFSQGAMICLDFVLHLSTPLGGVFPVCGFLREPKLEIDRFHPCQKNTPVLIGHGKNDITVPPEASKIAFELLKNQGANVELLLYNGRHKISLKYLNRMVEIINE